MSLSLRQPNEEVFDSRCDTKVRCQAGGQLQVSDYKSLRDPNSICTDDRPPRITCARGFTLVDRNGTDACQRKYMLSVILPSSQSFLLIVAFLFAFAFGAILNYSAVLSL